MSSESRTELPGRVSLRQRAVRVLAFIAHCAIAGALLFGGTAVLHERADAVGPVATLPPTTVQVATAKQESGYQTSRRFAGRLEAIRQTAVSAELGGKVLEILVREGQRVQQGQVIARLDTRTLRAQRAEQSARRKTLEKDRELARLNANRQLVLKDKGFTSGQAWDVARLQLETVQSSLGQLDAGIRTITIAIDKSVLHAPFTGTVGARLVDEGTMLAPGAPVLTLFDGAAPQVRVGLPPNSVTGLSSSGQYRLDTGERVVNGRLIHIRPDLNEVTRTVTAIFSLSAADLPRFGQIVELILPTHHRASGFWLPLAALKAGQRGLWDVLIVVQKDGQSVIARESVEVLHADGERVFVRGTLSNGALYVNDGAHRVTVGQPVEIDRT